MAASSIDSTNEVHLSPRTAPANGIPEEVRRIVAELTGYPLNIVTLTADVEDELGIDSVMLGEILSVLRERYALPPGAELRARIPASQLRTIGGIAEAVVAFSIGVSAHPAPSPGATPRLDARPVDPPRSSVSVLDELRQIFADLTSYPINILSPDADLEDDLGVDSVALGEIFSVLRERYALPSRSELGQRITPQQLRTIRGIAGIVATFGNVAADAGDNGGPAPAIAPEPAPVGASGPAPAPSEKSDGRTRAITWADPRIGLSASRGMTGLDYLRAASRGEFPLPPMASLLGFTVTDIQPGRAVAEVYPAEYHYNPMGVVHGGLAATVLDTAMACAVHSTLPAGPSYTTLELKVNLVRSLTAEVGRLRAVAEVVFTGGKIATAQARLLDDRDELYAHATETCLITQRSGVE
jgi:uncharacterized protein (TIGR00369 family)